MDKIKPVRQSRSHFHVKASTKFILNEAEWARMIMIFNYLFKIWKYFFELN